MRETLDDIKLVPEPTKNGLEPTKRVRYKQHCRQFRDWLHTQGKGPS